MKILIDTREKEPLTFAFHDNVDIEFKKLDIGDYQIEGTDLIFERKANTNELYINLFTKDKTRFAKVVDKLIEIGGYVLCEFPESDLYTFPENSGIPENRWSQLRVNPKYFRLRIYQLREKGLKFVFCDNRAKAEEFILQCQS